MDDAENEKPIKAVAEIRRNSDGLIRRYETEYYGDFVWAEGNFSCDCNREIFFAAAAGENDSDRQCGDTAYTLRIVAADDGRELYRDDAWNAN